MRPMRNLAWILMFSAACAGTARGARGTNPFLDYRDQSWFLPQTPSVTAGPVGGQFNPAAFALNDLGSFDFWWDDGNIRPGLDNYGLAFGRNLNFAVNTSTYGTHAESWKIYDYQLGVAGGARKFALGLAYRWSRGETDRAPRDDALVLGAINRAAQWLSCGVSGVVSLGSSAAQGVFDLGVRPLGSDLVTVFADWTIDDDERFFADGTWGAGVDLRPVRGLQIGARFRDGAEGDTEFAVTTGLTFGFGGFVGMPRFDGDSERVASHWLVRSQPPLRALEISGLDLGRSQVYVPLSLENKFLTYQKYQYFDDDRVAWLDLLPWLNAVRDEADVDIVAVNLAGFRGRPSLIWELREKLKEIRVSGKELIVHVDNPGALTYWLASVADHVSLDPYGMVAIPGQALSRSYLKGTLEKLGLGFQEHRYFKYKSATETLSRENMSDADREQRQRIVDVIYETLRDGMARSRDLDPAVIDGLVDEQAILTADEARSAGLVDDLARWDDMLQSLRRNQGARPPRRPPSGYPRKYWTSSGASHRRSRSSMRSVPAPWIAGSRAARPAPTCAV